MRKVDYCTQLELVGSTSEPVSCGLCEGCREYDSGKAAETVINSFPAEFGLRAFPGRKFSIRRAACYISNGVLTLYTDIWNEDNQKWLSFAKGTEQELRKEVVRL